MRRRLIIGLSVAGLLMAGCGNAGAGAAGGTASKAQRPSASSPARTLEPAGPTPSEVAKMVCAKRAQSEINTALGVAATVSKPTWVDHDYACVYRYKSGSFTMSVKELSSWSQTLAYFRAKRASLGYAGSLGNLGEGAFSTKGGSVIVRKDWKILDVDTAALPPSLGRPLTPRADVAITIADVILGCWSGD